jgi:hypothetical protein
VEFQPLRSVTEACLVDDLVDWTQEAEAHRHKLAIQAQKDKAEEERRLQEEVRPVVAASRMLALFSAGGGFFHLLTSALWFLQRDNIRRQAEAEAQEADRQRDAYVAETEARLAGMSFSFSWD